MTADARIDEMSPEPLYQQLAAILRARIERGDWRPRTPIPSESQLVGEYGLSRPTVRHAVAVLAEEGLVVTIPQRGSFVVEPESGQAEEAR